MNITMLKINFSLEFYFPTKPNKKLNIKIEINKMVRNKITLTFIVLSTLLHFPLLSSKTIDTSWENEVGAKTTPPTQNVYTVNDYGLPRNHDLVLVTEAIQATIDKCSENGGGIVQFEPGTYLTGAIFLKNNVNLHIGENVTLLAIQDVSYFPNMKSRIAGIEMEWPSGVINVLGKTNVAVTGKGTINAQGRYLWEKYWNMRTEYVKKGLRWIIDYDCDRVRTVVVSDSKNVTLSDLTLKQSGFWTVHVLYSEHVTVDGIIIRNNEGGHGPSTDGIDIDSSTKILVQNCDVDCHDDNFCLKAGRDADGLRVNKPTEYVVFRNCISRVGAAVITVGSETSGSIRNIHVYNMKAIGTSAGVKIKSALTRGGTVENIYIHDIDLENVGVGLSFGLNWNPSYSYSELPEGYHLDSVPDHWKTMLQKVDPKQGIPKIKNIVVENLTGKNVRTGVSAEGIEASELENFTFKNIEIECKNAGSISYGKNWSMDNVKFITENKENSQVNITNSEKVKFKVY